MCKTTVSSTFTSVYGPVTSWRYGRSLGIDPIGATSTCSFNCVYCQLGEIEQMRGDRDLFVPTSQIQQELAVFSPWDVDIITLSGSGEPTLARNLGEIIVMVKQMTHKPVGVLTNGTLLADPQVKAELALADLIAVKVDAVDGDRYRRINRPVESLNLEALWAALASFRQIYTGRLGIQTMILSPWSDREQAEYIRLMQQIQPDEIQLNTPTRPKPLTHQLDARGNHTLDDREYPTRSLKPVSLETLKAFGDRIHQETKLLVRYPTPHEAD
ncbi:MAG: radical SAM protein [Desertifilum sp.]|nr:radical SAM protein [Desertifilum sp.]